MDTDETSDPVEPSPPEMIAEAYRLLEIWLDQIGLDPSLRADYMAQVRRGDRDIQELIFLAGRHARGESTSSACLGAGWWLELAEQGAAFTRPPHASREALADEVRRRLGMPEGVTDEGLQALLGDGSAYTNHPVEQAMVRTLTMDDLRESVARQWGDFATLQETQAAAAAPKSVEAATRRENAHRMRAMSQAIRLDIYRRRAPRQVSVRRARPTRAIATRSESHGRTAKANAPPAGDPDPEPSDVASRCAEAWRAVAGWIYRDIASAVLR